MGLTVLDRIFATKHDEVAVAKRLVSEADLREIVRDSDLATRGFISALNPLGDTATPDHQGRIALIAEVKKASPSQGVIRENFDPAAIAKAYEQAGAQCLSVLTDAPYFQGSAENLRICRATTPLPILRKDFIDDAYQVWEARAWGADAILLIVASLSDQQLQDLHGLAAQLGLDVLVEVHDQQEAERALTLGANLIGINNRDLRTFKTDIGTTERIAPLLSGKALVVSESAVETYVDVRRAAAAGAGAVLIGTTFCAAEDIGSKVREVMGDLAWSG